MLRPRIIHLPSSPNAVEASRNFEAVRGAEASQVAADENLVVERAGRTLARCALWWKTVPRYGDERLGLIGQYFASDTEAALHLLGRAGEELRGRGCTMAVGPMDGSTWRNYRLITERGSEPIFFLEPDNPDEWPRQFAAAGFSALAHYYSAITNDFSPRTSGTPRAPDCEDKSGVEIRPIRMENFEQELRRGYAIVCESFRENFLFTPIGEDDFIAQYRPLRSHVSPELVLLAEKNGSVAGFVFAVPDYLQLGRANAIDTVIVKTLAVRPECAGAGLGSLLTVRVHQAARELGYRRAVHALMHENNASRQISAALKARTIRRYTLFAKRLDECH